MERKILVLKLGGRQAHLLKAKCWPLKLGGRQAHLLKAKYQPFILGRTGPFRKNDSTPSSGQTVRKEFPCQRNGVIQCVQMMLPQLASAEGVCTCFSDKNCPSSVTPAKKCAQMFNFRNQKNVLVVWFVSHDVWIAIKYEYFPML